METSRARTSRSQQNASAAEPTSAPAQTSGTGATRKPRAAAHQRGAASADPARADPVDPLDPALIVRTLRAVADELERDPDLASRVAAASGLTIASPAPFAPAPDAPSPSATTGAEDGAEGAHTAAATTRPADRATRTFRPRIVTGASSELGPGIPDPFALRARLGADGLAAALAELRLGTLRAILREYGLDPDGHVGRQNDASRLRAHIARAVEAR